jgi:hypothetical protein
LGKKWKKGSNSRKNVKITNFQKFAITNLKEKRLFLMIKSLKVIPIIPTLNT